MKSNKCITIGSILISISVFLFLISNTYFGFNTTAQSVSELRLYYISKVILCIGIGIYFTPLLKMYEKAANDLKNK